jgi:hypothetical protein
MKRVIGIGILLLIVGCTPKPRIADSDRREHLLMPNKDSKAYTEWVARYGDSAESWELFTLGFHTRYINQLTKQIRMLTEALQAYPDPNDIITDPNEIARIVADTQWTWYDYDGMKISYIPISPPLPARAKAIGPPRPNDTVDNYYEDGKVTDDLGNGRTRKTD